MNVITFFAIFASVLLSSVSQVLLKSGMVSSSLRDALATGQPGSILFAVLATPSILLGLACFGISLILWLYVLARIPLSTAYPFVALGITFTVIAGAVLFSEPLSPQKIAGIILIVAGIVTMSIA